MVALILIGVLLLAANLYVQSQGVQQRIREALTTHLRMPVTLKKTTITPWDGLRLDGIVLHAEESGAESPGSSGRTPDFLSVGSFRVRFAWWPLLSQQRYVIDRVLLDKPRLVWQQSSDGRWEFPPEEEGVHRAKTGKHPSGTASPLPGSTTKRPDASPPTAESSDPATLATDTTPAPDLLAPLAKPPAEMRAARSRSSLPVSIDKVHLRHGTFEFLTQQRRPMCRVEEVNLDGSLSADRRATGALWFDRAVLSHTGLALTKFRSAFIFDETGGLELRNGHGELAGGELQTDYQLHTGEAGSPFAASCRLKNVDLGQLARVSGGQPSLLEGQLQGSTDFHGLSDDPESRQGAGRLWLVGAKLRDFPLLQVLGQSLRIPDLTRLQFKQAEINYRLEGTTLQIDPLTLTSNDLRMVVHGQYLTEMDRLDLHARLVIDQAISHQLPQFIESNFTACGDEAPGSRYLDFDVKGRLDDPKSNLYDRMMAGPMKGLLDNLLAPPKPKIPKDKRHKHDDKPRPDPSAPEGT